MSDLAPTGYQPAPQTTESSSDIPLWLVLGLVLVMIAGVGLVGAVLLNQDEKEDKGPTYPAQWDARVAPYVKKVEELRGRTFMHPVEVRFLPRSEFEKGVTADEKDLDKDGREQMEQTTGLLRAIGLISGDLDLFDAVNDLRGSGTLAYYSFDDERITIRGEKLTPAVRSTLVHELTHALQDQHFDVGARLEKIAKRPEDSRSRTDALLHTLVEGDAERVQTLYREGLGPKQRRALDADTRGQSKQATKELEGVPKILLTMFTSDYTLGEALIQVVAEDDGNEGLDELLRDTPTDDSALLDPLRELAGGDDPVDVDYPLLREGETEIDSSEFGALTWYFMLAERLPLLDALAAADGWGGDASVTFERDGTACARLAYTGDTLQDTTRMHRALKRWIAAAPGAPSTVSLDGDLVRFESCDPGKEAAKVGKDSSEDALQLVATRAYLGLGIMRSGAPTRASRCLAGRLVREYPLSRLNDPQFGAGDPAVSTRVRQLALACR